MAGLKAVGWDVYWVIQLVVYSAEWTAGEWVGWKVDGWVDFLEKQMAAKFVDWSVERTVKNKAVHSVEK